MEHIKTIPKQYIRELSKYVLPSAYSKLSDMCNRDIDYKGNNVYNLIQHLYNTDVLSDDDLIYVHTEVGISMPICIALSEGIRILEYTTDREYLDLPNHIIKAIQKKYANTERIPKWCLYLCVRNGFYSDVLRNYL